MRNFWLEKKGIVKDVTLTQAVVEYQNTQNHDEAYLVLQPMLKKLAEQILNYAKIGGKKLFDDNKAVVEDCVLICFQKLHRYNATKGKAFNFFTTIMLGHMRQLYRTQRASKEALSAKQQT